MKFIHIIIHIIIFLISIMETQHINYSDLKIIGAGGFGTVYELPDNTVIKAMKNKTDCHIADVEMEKQSQIYKIFTELRQTLTTYDYLIQLMKTYIKVSKPLKSHNYRIIIDTIYYS